MFKIDKYITVYRSLHKAPAIRHMSCGEKCPPVYECKQPEPSDIDKAIAELREMRKPRLFKPCHPTNVKLWKTIFYVVCVPTVICAYINAFFLSESHHKRPKFIEYEYLRIRNKEFPWDPVRTLFHNPKVNALPTGYEVEVPEEDEVDPRQPKCQNN